MTMSKLLFQKHSELTQTYSCPWSPLMFTMASQSPLFLGSLEGWGLAEVESYAYSFYTRSS